jgi:hypothetical protein
MAVLSLVIKKALEIIPLGVLYAEKLFLKLVHRLDLKKGFERLRDLHWVNSAFGQNNGGKHVSKAVEDA